MTPRQYRQGGGGVVITHVTVSSPVGPMMIGATDRGLCFVQFGDSQGALLKELKNVQNAEHTGANKWKLVTKDTDALRKEVMQWALNHDVNISSLQAQTESLEDVFRSLTKN